MWVADAWRDYELLDCSSGEKLERWGKYILRRPEPQAIWNTPLDDPRWETADAVYRREGGGGRWVVKNVPESWEIGYGDLRFLIKPMNFKHTGLFPEQAVNWDYMRRRISEAGREISVLNLFAYTGAATSAAAAAGARVCHVDAAKGMVSHAKENARLSGLSEKPVRWLVDDCFAFAAREKRRGHRYDAIIMDPPSYGRGPSGEVWRLEDSLWDFLRLCSSLLSDEPLFVIINSYTTGLSASTLTYLCEAALGPRFGGHAQSSELGLRASDSGLVLPCGAACRWEA